MTVKDDTSYIYVTTAPEVGEYNVLRIDPTMRRQCNSITYPMRGGSNNCTLYVGVECEGLCVFVLSTDSTTTRNSTI